MFLTSYDKSPGDVRHYHPDIMREFRRPTLCVIDENGIEVSQPTEKGHILENDLNGNGVKCKVTSDDYSVCDHNANVTKIENGNFLSPHVEKDLDLCELKATAARLKLSTRRKSTVAWQQEHLDASQAPLLRKFDPTVLQHKMDDTFTEERKTRINEALAWIRSELIQMRSEDEVLARKLLSIRHDIHKLKLQRSCEEHQEMLDDVTLDMEENDVINMISDIPLTDSVHDTPLKHLGVTRMHLSARRFSIL